MIVEKRQRKAAAYKIIKYFHRLAEVKHYDNTLYPIAQRLFAMRRYGGGILYAALPLHMQRGCFRKHYDNTI